MSPRCPVLAVFLAVSIAAPSPAVAGSATTRRKAAQRQAALEQALAAAREQRHAVIREARELTRNDPHAGAVRLAEAAVALDDLALVVEAAAAYVELRSEHATLQARRLAGAAREQLAAVPDPEADLTIDVQSVRLTRDEADALAARCAVIDEQAGALHQEFVERRLRERRGRTELRAGVVLTAVGLAGVGLLAGGLVSRDEPRFPDATRPNHLNTFDTRANAMIAAGAITAAAGLVTGAVLLGLGISDLRPTQRSRRHARVRVTPAIAGVHIIGRF